MGYNMNSGYGQALLNMVSSIIPTFGRIFVVFNSSNTDEENYQRVQEVMKSDYKGQIRFFTSLSDAYDATESDNDDVILLDANSSHSNAMITVSKNRIHFIGMDGGGRLNSQGAKVVVPATSVAASTAVIKNTGIRNSYRNIKFIQQGTNVAQLTAFHDTGEGTYVKNCSFHHNSLITTAARSALRFEGDTCHYEDCQIGNAAVRKNVDNVAPLLIKTPARYTYFVNCRIIQYSQKTTASIIDVPDANGVIGWIQFNGCTLINGSKGDGVNASGTMAEAVTSVCTSGYLYFDSRCNVFQATRFAEADASILSAAIEPKISGTGGIAIVSA